jgi:hypothetical protein
MMYLFSDHQVMKARANTLAQAPVQIAIICTHLHSAQQRDSGGIIDDSLPKDHVEKERCTVLF